MRLPLKRFADARLARKIAVLRVFCAVVGVSVLGLIVFFAASGEMTVRGSSSGGRFVSDGALKVIRWSDSPGVYLLSVLWYVAISIAFVGALYLALAKTLERRHGRRSRFFRKK